MNNIETEAVNVISQYLIESLKEVRRRRPLVACYSPEIALAARMVGTGVPFVIWKVWAGNEWFESTTPETLLSKVRVYERSEEKRLALARLKAEVAELEREIATL